MANISNVVNVSLLLGGQLALADNPNVVMMMTSEQGSVLSSASRYRIYSDAGSVAQDFGSGSETYSYALTFFGTQPNPVNAGGFLVVGFWRAATETVAATAASLTGAQVSLPTVLGGLQSVSDGSMVVTVDGVAKTLSSLDFRTSTTLAEVAAVINAALVTATGATCALNDAGDRLVITSATTGAASLITFASAHSSGTFVGNVLALATGSGGFLTQGADSSTPSAETKLAAITELLNQVKFRGAMFINTTTDEESEDLGEWAQANDVLMYDVFNAAANLNVDPANVVWKIKLAGYTNCRMLYSKVGNRKMAASYMARAHTVNFGAENSALTMHLKTLNVAAEDYTQTEINKAQVVGLDLYTTIKLTSCILTSGANNFVDERYNLIAFVDFLQIDIFNVLKGTSTKIPQTNKGVSQLVDQCEKTSRQFVRAGVAAPGTWNSTDSFGNRTTFEQNILDNGFYWLSGSLAAQSSSAREAREAPVIQGAIKMAGAIHSADIIVNVNR